MYFEAFKENSDFYFYLWMLLLRRAEEKVLELFANDQISGTTHLYIGQEANAVGFIKHLSNKVDYVISNHRCHGHYLAFGGELSALFGELMGKDCGASKGFGGSQHIKGEHFFSSGIQGGFTPIACGLAYGAVVNKQKSVVVCCIGDGTLGQGVLYESLNIASLWSLPVIYLVENNRYAQTTPVAKGVAGKIIDRGKAFGIYSVEITSEDVNEIAEWGKEIINKVRSDRMPCFAVINTNRLCAHSKGDDSRSQEEIMECHLHDPLLALEPKIAKEKIKLSEQLVSEIVEAALETANSSCFTAYEK